MAKVKLNLANGTSEERSIITSFEVEGKRYLILDAESVGSMGLPIILVSSIVDNKVTKIVDPTEWQNAKNYLKNIIAGNNVNYISVAEEMAADDIYFTQLTLPVASFDLIKEKYTVPVPSEPVEAPTAEVAPISMDPVSMGATPVVPDATPVETPVVAPVENNIGAPEAAAIDFAPFAEPSPVTPEPVAQESVVEPSMTDGTAKYSQDKEAFMKACENMFDALVAKFENEYKK